MGGIQVILSAPTSVKNEYSGSMEEVQSVTALMNQNYIFYMVRCRTSHVGVAYIYDLNTNSVILESYEFIADAPNFWNDEIVAAYSVYDRNEGKDYRCLSLDSIDEIKVEQYVREFFVKESKDSGIGEVYVFGDYIYYTPNAHDYSNKAIYKVKINGTDWQEIY